MVLQPFSIPDHIQKIKSGEKSQTTRQGLRDIKVGTKLHQYFRPRMKRGTCDNCIQDCTQMKKLSVGFAGCSEWDNFFGVVPCTSVHQYPFGLQELHKLEFEGWAYADGFNSIEEAEQFFIKNYGIGWRAFPMTIIKWDNSLREFK